MKTKSFFNFLNRVKKVLLWPFTKLLTIKRRLDFEKKQVEIFKTLQKRIDFELLGTCFPFWKQDRPQNAKEAIEFLGEFVVTVTIKQNEETRFLLQADREKEVLLDFATTRLVKRMDEYLETALIETLNEIAKEYGIFTKLADKVANMVHQVKKDIMEFVGHPEASNQNPPKEFIQRILDRRFSSQKINDLISDSIRQINTEIEEKLKAWASSYHTDSKSYFQFSFSNIRWNDPLLNGTGKALVASTGFTFVLATGWHTLEWSFANFFPPALLASGAIALFNSLKDKDQTIAALQDVSRKLVMALAKHIHEIIQSEIKPIFSVDLEKQKIFLVELKKQELWGTKEDLTTKLTEWLSKIESAFGKIGVKSSEAESKFQMETNLEKGRQYLITGPIEAAIYCFGQSFDGFALWCQRKRTIDWDPQKQSYVQFIELMKEKGFDAGFITEFNKLRRKRNDFIHENYLLSQNEFEEVKTDLINAFNKIEELVIYV